MKYLHLFVIATMVGQLCLIVPPTPTVARAERSQLAVMDDSEVALEQSVDVFMPVSPVVDVAPTVTVSESTPASNADSSALTIRLQTADGTPLPQQTLTLVPITSGDARATDASPVQSATTNTEGMAEFPITMSRAAQSSTTKYYVQLDSKTWQIDQTTVVDATSLDAQILTADLIPIVFVPGIMGSYLDYKGSNGTVCNIWPTKDNNAECAELSNLSFEGCVDTDYGCKRAKMLRLINDPRVYATDVTREQFSGVYDLYGTVLNRLNTTWPEYKGGADTQFFLKTAQERCEIIEQKVNSGELDRNNTMLYAFGYDWRQSTRDNAEKLSNFIDCVRRIHNNAKVSLVGHSMGGLVIKQLLLNYKDSSSVARVSTFNTPYLGAVTALSIFGTGIYDGISVKCVRGWCPDWPINPLITPNDLKRLAPALPGAIELLPSNLYLHQYPCRLVVDNKQSCSKDEYWNSIAEEIGEEAAAHQLTDDVGRDDTGDIVERTKNIDYLIQFSSNKNTTKSLVKKNRNKWTSDTGPGDGTVNEFSLSRISQDGSINWTPINSSTRNVTVKGYCNEGQDHTGLVQYTPALNQLVDFLSNDNYAANTMSNTCQDGSYVALDDNHFSNFNFTNLFPVNGEFVHYGNWRFQWNYTGRSPRSFYIEITSLGDTNWQNPHRACIPSGRSQIIYLPSPAYLKSIDGVYKWRVRASDIVANAANCISANSGQTSGWSNTQSFVVVKLTSSLPTSGTVGFPQRFVANTLSQAWVQAQQNLANITPPKQYMLTIYQTTNTSIGAVVYKQCNATPDIVVPYSEMVKLSGEYVFTYSVKVITPPLSPTTCDNEIYYQYDSVPVSFTVNPVLIKPTLLSPNDEHIQTNGYWPSLSWQEPQNVVPDYGYRIQVSKDPLFKKDVLVDECRNTTSYLPDNLGWMLERFGKMYWRVNYVQSAWGNQDQDACKQQELIESTWSATRSFTSDISPNAVLPANQTIVRNGVWPTLTWTPILDQLEANGYRIQVSKDATFKTTVVDECVRQRQYTPSGDGATAWMLAQYGTFYWRVSYAQGTWSTLADCKKQRIPVELWSDVRSFTAAWQPQLTFPSDGAIGSSGSWPVMSWKTDIPALATNGYRIQVSRTSDFKTLEVDECKSGTSYQPDNFWWQQARMGNFYWRVNYVKGVWSDQTACKKNKFDDGLWSEVRVFNNPQTVKSASLLAPVNNFVSADGLWPTLSWASYSSAFSTNGYRLQVSRDAKFTNNVVDECRTGTTYLPNDESFMRAQNGKFYWRINYLAASWDGNQSTCKNVYIEPLLWSSPSIFSNFQPMNPVVVQSPSNLYVSTNGGWPSLTWTNGAYMQAPHGYRIQVSTNPQFRQLEVDECRRSASYQPDNFWWQQARMGTYYWRVNYVTQSWDSQAQCKRSRVDERLWNTPFAFVNPVVNKTPGMYPNDGYTQSDGLWPRLYWGAYNTPFAQYGYRLQVSRDASFRNLIVDECRTDTNYLPNDVWWMRENSGKYYWRVNYLANPWNQLASTCSSVFVENKLWSTPRIFTANPLIVTLSGKVTDASTARNIVGAQVCLSQLRLCTETDTYGNYRFSNIRAQRYTMVTTFQGYISNTDTVSMSSSTSYNVSLSSTMRTGEMRIVLTWLIDPRDLDSHLWTPTGHHIYFGNKMNCSITPFACLDHDDTSSYGPETVTISKWTAGTYYYSVYHFSGAGSITTTSGAKVEVYFNNRLIREFYAPTSGSGRWWNLMSIDGTTKTITVINTISN